MTRTPRWALLEGFSVEKEGRPYLDRLRVVQTPWFGVYVHRIHGPDRDRGPHDHPWWFASLVVSGGYSEEIWDDPSDAASSWMRERGRWSLRTVRRSQAHQIPETRGVLWTLVLTGPRRPSWRFWIDGHPVDWKDYETAGAMAGNGAPDERTALWAPDR